ncbi:NAD(P)H-dependent glycerol-3-phosphate dehydrogenase [Nakamurella endophytica]|uniref:Glycerol-3-phosphate dehydrogenase [NAD(P)+] n=1 Tax=Nakamurella endophytica TaxID=1748367 RepID=A0A917WA67_9ACTN|nr:NAD(P)H-dependent glycerol-3-phosphate dehydrogenase [Nakamurella endophytica]GGL84972.1 glycerol-3-phosphate dehydrogenase [NAD(P)+] [Nakamurella endophytica]
MTVASTTGSGTAPLQRFAVLGAGSWGTTFGKVLADAGRDVTIWARRDRLARSIDADHVNPDYLPGVHLPATLHASADLDAVLDGVDAVALAVPSQSLRENLVLFREVLPPGVPVVSLAKGVEIGTDLRMSELIGSVGRVAASRIVVLTGPNLAKEIAADHPTASVLACTDHDRAVAVQAACATPYFRPYTITDVVGAEIAGTGKNIVAVACGLADGLGLGLNTVASLITRGLAELTRLGVALGASAETFAGLAGLGDLVATCSSPLSRNRTLGARLAAGEELDAALAAMGGQVAEGVVSCRSVRDLAHRHGIDMPITEAVFRVCYRHLPPPGMIRFLMDRPHSRE